jgi:superfamily II DNA or RNA helicase
MNVAETIKLNFNELSEREMRKLEKELTFVRDADVVTCFRKMVTRGYYKLPRGAWAFVPDHVEYVDQRSRPKLPKLNFTVQLDAVEKDERYEGQSQAVASMFEHEQGQIIRPPGTGKTQIALAFAAQCETRTLVLVHTKDILEQWVNYTEQAIPELRGKVGIIQGKTYKVGQITIATVQTIRKYILDHPRDWWKQWGCVIADEGHHAAAPSWEQILNMCPAHYRFAFTASATRADGLEKLITYLVGPIIHRQKFRSTVELHVKQVDTGFAYPYRGAFDWGNLVRALIHDEPRNTKIAQLIDKEVEEGNSVLVLSRRIDHLHNIAALMSSDTEVLTGKRSQADRNRILKDFRAGKLRVLLATQLADEALDVPVLNRVFLVHPGKHEGRIIQQIGRAIRQHPDKQDAIIYDFVDKVRVLKRQADQRQRTYRANRISIRKAKTKKRRLLWR